MEKLVSIYFEIPALRPGTVGAYSLAFVSFVLAMALRFAIDPYLMGGVQFITFYPAVIVTTLLSGFGAGLFCAALSLAGSMYFLLQPHWSLYILVEDPGNAVLLLLFIVIILSNVILITGLRYSVERFKEHEEKEHLLMREINHRAKNLLSVVAAIAHQTVSRNLRTFSSASPSVSRPYQPIRTCSSGANGRG
jgi:K+-sensing histidine kinase KdpD